MISLEFTILFCTFIALGVSFLILKYMLPYQLRLNEIQLEESLDRQKHELIKHIGGSSECQIISGELDCLIYARDALLSYRKELEIVRHGNIELDGGRGEQVQPILILGELSVLQQHGFGSDETTTRYIVDGYRQELEVGGALIFHYLRFPSRSELRDLPPHKRDVIADWGERLISQLKRNPNYRVYDCVDGLGWNECPDAFIFPNMYLESKYEGSFGISIRSKLVSTRLRNSILDKHRSRRLKNHETAGELSPSEIRFLTNNSN